MFETPANVLEFFFEVARTKGKYKINVEENSALIKPRLEEEHYKPVIIIKDLNKFAHTYSLERLQSFVYSKNDTLNDIINNYSNNVKISQAIYPELCTLEVILRNSIDNVLKQHISKTWIEDEIKNNNSRVDNLVSKTWEKKINSIPSSQDMNKTQNDLDIPSFLRKKGNKI